MSIAGVLPPIWIDGHLLVDGCYTNNLPGTQETLNALNEQDDLQCWALLTFLQDFVSCEFLNCEDCL